MCCLRAIPALLLVIAVAVAEPVQYCRFGHDVQSQNAEVDFCLGLTMHQNASSQNYDMYMAMTVTRSSALGWTAVGTGSVMAGSLMFIIYGDPYANEPPIVSVRTVDGHHQPRLVSQADMGAADLRLLQADWMPASKDDQASSTPVVVAKVALVCYSCEKWPGTPISATAASQPWIWAWNENQEFSVYSYDTHLDMHRHHAGNGGWGHFYVDMARSIAKSRNPPSLPIIRAHVSALGASDSPAVTDLVGWFNAGGMGLLHGVLLATAYLILLPVGVVAMRSGSTKAFKYHWIVQIIGAIFIWIGVALGIVHSHGLDTVHQWLGITVAVGTVIQSLLGWRHHVVFVKTKRRQWASHAHIWLGRIILICGWGNIISGMVLSGHGSGQIAFVSTFIAVDAVALIGWVWVMKRRKRRETQHMEQVTPYPPWKAQGNEYFALTTSNDDDDDERSSQDISESSTLANHKDPE
ncbi:hypothetical protein EYZ11_009509 [Aspergillus tanneri]|uniref:Cytochrome b561 domain-containing protein n=1 Tax=Aspergillus tanneri TaxID=1220188 RepID=A0A4S3J9V6_9EURO|nr:uncharacterized protein ATNIH1004_006751 [Aspergillus tanneri]KAA8645332.1 hypothetical protein ATNIH1004_006751 [Aspergillus tanneri]THC91027.1 hypothetical protein EYZ11_009509 [Aspergillus tanneri]